MNRRFFIETLLILLLLFLLGFMVFVRFSDGQWADGNNNEESTERFFGWLRQRGHPVQVTEGVFNLENTAVLFIMAPQQQLTFIEIDQLNQWLFRGGTLFIIQDQTQSSRLLNQFNVRSRRLLFPQADADFNLPTLNWPLVGEPALQTRRRFIVPCGEVAVHLGNCNEAHLATFSWGSGQVVLLSSLYPLSNAGLQNPANAQLMQNLVDLVVQPNEAILVTQSSPTGVGAVVRSTTGWMLLATAVLIVAYLFWQNQPFQNPVGHANITPQPETLESTNAFINHLATAQKELDPDRNVRDHYWRQVKRRYANRHGFDPNQTDEQFLDRLRHVEEEDVMGRLIYLMTTMVKQQVDDLELMNWTAVSLDELSDT